MSLISVDRVRELFVYDPETGLIISKKTGGVACKLSSIGYRRVRVPGVYLYAHRIAWALANGEIPASKVIDHINGNKADNRIINLRLVPTRTNIENQRLAQRGSRTGVLGVHWHVGKYVAAIVVDGKKIHLGRFNTVEEAHDVYLKAKRRMHEGCSI